MGDVSRPLADLSPAKRKLLLQRLAREVTRREDGERSVPPMLPMPRDKVLPLSFAQQRLWFLEQLEPGTSSYNLPAAFHLKGPLNVDALARGLNEIVRRHQVLRTTFVAVDGQPVQVVASALSLRMPIVDVSELAETERKAEAQRLMTAELQQPFDLAWGPLVRSTLVRLGEEEHVLLVTMHHIVSDGWSLGVFNRELGQLYAAFRAGQPSPLPELDIQYADYAHWQREWLQGQVLEAQLGYWKQQLDHLPTLELPTDRPRPAVQTFRGACQTLELSKSLTEEIKALSLHDGCTLFMTLLAAFMILLHRHTGQADIAIGVPIAGRNRKEIEGLIGFFVNTLVLRVNLADNPTFRDLLSQVREMTLEAYTHQDLPFERLVEALQPERDLGRHPLFDIMFNLVNTPELSILRLPGIEARAWELDEPESKFAMTLYAEERDSRLVMQLVYQCALFSDQHMSALLDQLQSLLKQIVGAPEKLIQSYSLVTAAARRLLPDPSAVLLEPPYELVTNMFAAWASRLPDQTSVCQGDHVWTYSALFESACTLARALLAQRLEHGDVVAVFGPRSLGFVAGMLGALLSGGTLLTIDTNLPSERQRLILHEAGARYLLYVGGRQPEDEWLQELDLVILNIDPDKGWTLGLQKIPDVPLPELTSNDPAYLFFTSGTTGVPKGVLGQHKGLSHFLSWQRKTFAIQPRDRAAQLTALSFDVVLRDIFLPLTSGATLCLPEESDEIEPDRILYWLERERISILHTVPTLAQIWLTHVPLQVSLSNLRWVFFAGEPLPEALVRGWRAAFPQAGELVNLYGPTETTLAKLFYRVPADALPGIQPIGWPLPETQALVLAENGQLCGISEPGEIVLRTPFRSLGYVNAAEENQKRFVKTHFRDDDKDLLYFSGDRGRYRVDGSLEILGRFDDQVKIRGVRIEPNEVTATLAQHPSVKACAVVAWKKEGGDTFLAAYVVQSKPANATSHDLRLYLSKKLPAAMVPSTFVMLDTLPLTPNGKLDRRALPPPDQILAAQEKAFVAPRTPIEETLAEIWAQVLGLERVGIYNNFFELGGHSLAGIQVISRASQAFQVKLPLRSLFESPTVAGLAERIQAARQMDQPVQSPARQPLPSESTTQSKESPVSYNQERWLLRAQKDPSLVWHSGGFFRLQGPLNVVVLEQCLSEIVRRHQILRTTFAVVEGRHVQIISPASSLSLPIVDLRNLSAAEQEPEIQRLATEEAQRPFDRSRDILLRAVLLQLGQEEYVLILLIDHIASDGWSLRVLQQHISALYAAFSAGAPSPLPELPFQYADLACWQKPWPQGEALESLLRFWKKLVGDHVPDLIELMLPADCPRPIAKDCRGAYETVVLPPSLSEALKALSRREGATLFMTLMAAFQTLLYRRTGQGNVLAGFSVANRPLPETELLIGAFAHGMVIHMNLASDPSFRELVGWVREMILEVEAAQGLSSILLAEAMEIKFGPDVTKEMGKLMGEASRVFFSFADSVQEPLQLPGLTVRRLVLDTGVALPGIALYVLDGVEGLTTTFHYRVDVFDVTTARRMLEDFRAVLEASIVAPEQRLSTLPLSDQSRTWSVTGKAVPGCTKEE